MASSLLAERKGRYLLAGDVTRSLLVKRISQGLTSREEILATDEKQRGYFEHPFLLLVLRSSILKEKSNKNIASTEYQNSH